MCIYFVESGKLIIHVFYFTGKERVVELPHVEPQTLSLTHTTTTVTREEVVTTRTFHPELLQPLEPEIYVRERGIARWVLYIPAMSQDNEFLPKFSNYGYMHTYGRGLFWPSAETKEIK